MPLPPHIEVITATLDLQLVRLLRQAIRTADIASGRGQPVVPLGPAPSFPAPGNHPVIDPAPHFEPRPVVHPAPRFEPRPRQHGCEPIRPKAVPVEVIVIPDDEPNPAKSPIEPPWKALPWEGPLPAATKLKLTIRQPDDPRKGTILDVFV